MAAREKVELRKGVEGRLLRPHYRQPDRRQARQALLSRLQHRRPGPPLHFRRDLLPAPVRRPADGFAAWRGSTPSSGQTASCPPRLSTPSGSIGTPTRWTPCRGAVSAMARGRPGGRTTCPKTPCSHKVPEERPPRSRPWWRPTIGSGTATSRWSPELGPGPRGQLPLHAARGDSQRGGRAGSSTRTWSSTRSTAATRRPSRRASPPRPRADFYSALTAAVSVLKGPKHGGAAEGAMQMAQEVGSVENAESYVSGLLANGQRVMGFGHAGIQGRRPQVGPSQGGRQGPRREEGARRSGTGSSRP